MVVAAATATLNKADAVSSFGSPPMMVGGVGTGGIERGTFADHTFDRIREQSKDADPEKTFGVGGAAVYSGYLTSNERDRELLGREKYRTYSEIIANVEIVATGVEYFLDLIAKPQWSVEPARDGGTEAHDVADLFEDVIFDLATPWNRVLRRIAMYRFYGFSIHEWTAKKRDDGTIGLLDLEVRPQITIERWDLDVFGTLHGVVQRSPQTMQQFYIPASKILHVVDDGFSNTPDGIGLFRSIVSTARQLERFEQLEGFGFETDLRGIPVGRAPLSELKAQLSAGMISAADFDAMLNPLKSFIEKHIKSPELGFLTDSKTYTTTDASQSPSSIPKWAIDLIQGGATSFDAIDRAIVRKTTEIARRLGIQHVMIGGASRGSQALSKDQSLNSAFQCDSALSSIARAVEVQLFRPLLALNGIDTSLCPTVKTEKVQWRDIEQVTSALKDLALAGNPLVPNDPANDDVRDLLGVARVPEEQKRSSMMDASLLPSRHGGVGQANRIASTPASGVSVPPIPKAAPQPGIQANGKEV